MLSKKIWIIEDMVDLIPVYESILKTEIFDLTFFHNFDEFKKAFQNKNAHPDLIIADIMLGEDHFFKLLNEAELALEVPYLVISSSDDLETMQDAFNAGAIDYILKPFNRNEIKAKVQKHLVQIEEKNHVSSKSLEALDIDLTQFTNKECKIIDSFNMKEDKILQRQEITKIIWKNITIHPNTLDVHIYNLRKKLKPFNYEIKSIGNGQFKFEKIS